MATAARRCLQQRQGRQHESHGHNTCLKTFLTRLSSGTASGAARPSAAEQHDASAPMQCGPRGRTRLPSASQTHHCCSELPSQRAATPASPTRHEPITAAAPPAVHSSLRRRVCTPIHRPSAVSAVGPTSYVRSGCHELGQNPIPRFHQNNSKFYTDERRKPATRGGQRGVLNLSVRSPYPKRIQPSL